MQRADSIFKSTKIFVEQTVGITTDTALLIRGELKHTSRLNGLENDSEYDKALMAEIEDIINAMESLTDSKADLMKRTILEKRLAKLTSLI